MKTLKEIHSEANKYSESEPLQDAFVAGARWALTGKYYKPSELFDNHAEVETVDLEVEETEKIEKTEKMKPSIEEKQNNTVVSLQKQEKPTDDAELSQKSNHQQPSVQMTLFDLWGMEEENRQAVHSTKKKAEVTVGAAAKKVSRKKASPLVKSVNPPFEEWWNAYNKKRGRKKAEAKWKKLSLNDKVACMKATPLYVASTPDPVYRKDPLTYLNGECWNDEIIQKQDYEQQRAVNLAAKAARILGSDYQG